MAAEKTQMAAREKQAQEANVVEVDMGNAGGTILDMSVYVMNDDLKENRRRVK